jgi:hypothetical protein
LILGDSGKESAANRPLQRPDQRRFLVGKANDKPPSGVQDRERAEHDKKKSFVHLWMNIVMADRPSRENCVPVNFGQSASEPGKIHIHVEFEKEDLADAFQREFGGPGSDPTL